MEKLGIGVQEFLQGVQVFLGGDVHIFMNGGLAQAERLLPGKIMLAPNVWTLVGRRYPLTQTLLALISRKATPAE